MWSLTCLRPQVLGVRPRETGGVPSILLCPSEKRPAATNFATLTDENLSYFTGLNADPSRPNSILAGDWNLTNPATRASSAAAATNYTFSWTKQVHELRGNVLFADGRIELLKSFSVTKSKAVTPVRSAMTRERIANSRSKTNEPPAGSRSPALSAPEKSGDHGLARADEPIDALTESLRANPPVLNVSEEARLESWDTETFRFVLAVIQAGYFLVLLIAILLLAMYFLRQRRHRARHG
jgi:prepilin-type processing-associated H-X9-DG protein